MKPETVRTTVDIPAPLYRKLKQQAAAKGRSIRDLVLAGVTSVLLEDQRPRSKRVKFPLIVSKGPKVDLTSERIYEYVEFPFVFADVQPLSQGVGRCLSPGIRFGRGPKTRHG